MDDFERELKIGFLAEAKQACEDVEQCFLSLESNPGDEENINKIFRLAHNLKGSSKAVGFDAFGEFTHEFESFILKIKNKELPATARSVDLLLRANDFVRQMIEGLTGDLAASFVIQPLIDEMKSFSDEPVENRDEAPAAEEPAIPAPAVMGAPVSLMEVQDPAPSVGPVPPAAAEKNPPKNASAPAEDSLRVSLQKIEHLINSVGEMVILQSGLKEQSQLLNSPALKKIVQHLSKVTKEIQETSMGLRMIPIKPVFQKMQRIVRDTSIALGKEIRFDIEGENTDIDKTILERISDPLVHLVRNSVDHGIEKAEVRQQSGKPLRGAVSLKAFHQSGKLVIEVSDDGGGLDAEKLKRKAIEKGLLAQDAKLTETEAYNLIFAPGFSTKEQVTDVSGRGVGMDVVKTNIHELGGEIQIQSQLGRGSTFRIVLPLTLAIVDAMILNCGDERFVVPISQVHETLKPEPQNYKESALGEILLLREENLPLFRLGDFFGLKSNKKATEMIAVVVRITSKPFAFLVDDITGQSQVVLKQLGPELQGLVGISGSTILGDGRPALVLETPELLKRPRAPGAPKDPSVKKVNV